MRDHEQNQTSSKRYGVKIEDNQLPCDYDRRILVHSNGCCSIPYESKQAGDLLDYFIDMMKWLEPNETVTGAAAWTQPDTLIATRVEYASTGVVVWLTGGRDNRRQNVYVQILTSRGRVKIVEFILHTCGIAGALAIITGEGDEVSVGSNIKFPLVEHGPKFKTNLDHLDFIGIDSPEQAIVITNEGGDVGFIYGIEVKGQFSQRNNGTQRIEIGESALIMVSYKPNHTGAHNGSISIDVGDMDDLTVSLHGQYA